MFQLLLFQKKKLKSRTAKPTEPAGLPVFPGSALVNPVFLRFARARGLKH
jgi:hypothetical protein